MFLDPETKFPNNKNNCFKSVNRLQKSNLYRFEKE